MDLNVETIYRCSTEWRQYDQKGDQKRDLQINGMEFSPFITSCCITFSCSSRSFRELFYCKKVPERKISMKTERPEIILSVLNFQNLKYHLFYFTKSKINLSYFRIYPHFMLSLSWFSSWYIQISLNFKTILEISSEISLSHTEWQCCTKNQFLILRFVICWLKNTFLLWLWAWLYVPGKCLLFWILWDGR